MTVASRKALMWLSLLAKRLQARENTEQSQLY